MKISVIHRYCEYHGDHSCPVSVAVDYAPGETLYAFAKRVLNPEKNGASETIEIRVIQEPKQ